MLRYFASVILLAFLPTSALADGVLFKWGAGDVEGMTEERHNAAKKRDVQALLQFNKQLTSWPEVYELMVGVMQHQDDDQLKTGLIDQIIQTEKTELQLTSRLIIWERISSGEILFEGTGFQVDDDLFSLAGRANWCLRTLTDRNFGTIRPNSTKSEIEQIQSKWRQFIEGKEVEDVPERFPSEKTGTTEIRSPEAIHALITSLKPSERKAEYTKSSLKRIYGLDEFPPKEELPSAYLCDPDTWTHEYLSFVTEVTDQHSWEWWEKWWSENKDKLVWDPETAKFKIK